MNKRYCAVEYEGEIYPIFFDNKECGRELTPMEVINRLNESNNELGKLKILYSAKCKTEDVLVKEAMTLERKIKELEGNCKKLSNEKKKLEKGINDLLMANGKLKFELRECKERKLYSRRKLEEEVNKLREKVIQLLTEKEKQTFICLTCEHGGYTEIGCLCEYQDCWVEDIHKCENYKEY